MWRILDKHSFSVGSILDRLSDCHVRFGFVISWVPFFFVCVFGFILEFPWNIFSSDFNCRPAAMRRFATKVGLQLRGFEQPNSGGRVAVKDRCSFEDHVRCRTFIGASMKR